MFLQYKKGKGKNKKKSLLNFLSKLYTRFSFERKFLSFLQTISKDITSVSLDELLKYVVLVLRKSKKLSVLKTCTPRSLLTFTHAFLSIARGFFVHEIERVSNELLGRCIW